MESNRYSPCSWAIPAQTWAFCEATTWIKAVRCHWRGTGTVGFQQHKVTYSPRRETNVAAREHLGQNVLDLWWQTRTLQWGQLSIPPSAQVITCIFWRNKSGLKEEGLKRQAGLSPRWEQGRAYMKFLHQVHYSLSWIPQDQSFNYSTL